MEFLQTPDFWIGLVKIIWINIILSGDNAVVIAMAARTLPPHQQTKAVVWGSAAAVLLRVLLTVVAAKLLALPYLQIVGGLLLLWIGVQLLGEEDDEDEGEEKHYGSMLSAIRTILIADLIMSLDNIIAVAAAAQGSMLLLILGLAISIPLVVFGSTLMIKLMERFPIIVTIGAGLIGWVAGEAIVSDNAIKGALQGQGWLHYAIPVLCAALVIGLGKLIQARRQSAQASSQQA
jgi:YjbE family integral membrane protein